MELYNSWMERAIGKITHKFTPGGKCEWKIVIYSLSGIQTIFIIEAVLGQPNPVGWRQTAVLLLKNLLRYATDLHYPLVEAGVLPLDLVNRQKKKKKSGTSNMWERANESLWQQRAKHGGLPVWLMFIFSSWRQCHRKRSTNYFARRQTCHGSPQNRALGSSKKHSQKLAS